MDKSGSAAAFGSRLHKIFADAVRAARATTLPDVEVEQSFFDGSVVAYGDLSSKRTDVLLRQHGHVVAMWDFKTGLAPSMTEARKKSIRDAINSEYPSILVDVIYVGYHYRMSVWGQ